MTLFYACTLCPTLVKLSWPSGVSMLGRGEWIRGMVPNARPIYDIIIYTTENLEGSGSQSVVPGLDQQQQSDHRETC